MTTAALAIGGRLRPPYHATGANVAEDTGGRFAFPTGRVRLVSSIHPDADAALDELAALRFGGVRSRALDWCIGIGAAVLADPATLGAADAAAALAVFCSGQDDG